MNRVLHQIALALALGASATASHADVVLTTGPYDNGASGQLGEIGTDAISFSAFGQTFSALGSTLNSFTLYATFGVGSTSFKSYLYAWDGQKIVGSALYTSAVQEYVSAPGITPFTFDTGGTALTSGGQYVAFFSTIGAGGGSDGSFWMPLSTPYADGATVFADLNFNDDGPASNGNFSTLLNSPWRQGNGDVMFSASFANAENSVPEPGSLALVSFALAGMASCAWRPKNGRHCIGK